MKYIRKESKYIRAEHRTNPVQSTSCSENLLTFSYSPSRRQLASNPPPVDFRHRHSPALLKSKWLLSSNISALTLYSSRCIGWIRGVRGVPVDEMDGTEATKRQRAERSTAGDAGDASPQTRIPRIYEN